MKCVMLIFVVLLLVFALAACNQYMPSNNSTPSQSTAPSTTPQQDTNTSNESAPDNMDIPDEIDITVSREGMEETLTGYLAKSSRFDYAIYLLPDFELLEIDGCDLIQPTEKSVLLQTICLQIYPANPGDAPWADENNNGAISTYEHVTIGNKTLQVQINYPLEASEGGLVLLRAMMDTLQASK